MIGIQLAERGLVPEPLIRLGIRQMLRSRIQEELARHADREEALLAFVRQMAASEVAPVPALPNRQHYEVPPAFFEAVLGPRLKYSSCLWDDGVADLAAAEEAMLRLTAERAGLANGQRILDLGCGWGSFTLWAAARYPGSRVTGVSNSAPQRELVMARARKLGLGNVEVTTADMNQFAPRARFDRVVSVEMFEHMRNWQELLRRIRSWLLPGGRLFIHVFASRRFAYPFETTAGDDWMGREFFTGGIMPSEDLLERVGGPFRVERRWTVPGIHYARTAEAWHDNLLRRRFQATAALARTLGRSEARRAVRRWRMFFLACAELFAWDGGREWLVSHSLLRPQEEP